LIQEQLCGFILDEIISPGGEFYAGLSSILSIAVTTGEGTTQNMKETSRSIDKGQASRSKGKGQASGSKNETLLTFHPMYVVNLNFSVQNMLMYNIISKVFQFQDLR
jgi:hypothetical protein